MKKETPRSLKREAGLANGLTTIAPDAGSLLWGETKGKAQSEREKRGLRHSDFSVASSSRSSGAITPPDGHFSAARLRPARSRKAWGRPGFAAMRAGAVVTMPSDSSLQPATISLNNYGLSFLKNSDGEIENHC